MPVFVRICEPGEPLVNIGSAPGAVSGDCDFWKLPPLPGRSLAQSIYLSGIAEAPAMCAGLGRCGLCRVKFIDKAPAVSVLELEILGAEAVSEGWRLACKQRSEPGMECELPEFIKIRRNFTSGVLPVAVTSAASCEGVTVIPSGPVAPIIVDKELGLAVDLGTSSIHWQWFKNSAPTEQAGTFEPAGSALRAGTEEIAESGGQAGEAAPLIQAGQLERGSRVNPQMGAGSDVIARLAEAARPGGLDRLCRLVRDTVLEVIRQSPFFPSYPGAICVAGNSVMTCLFLGIEPSSLAGAPYSLPYPGGSVYDFPGLPPVYVPPLLAPFIGGDISAGMAALLSGDCGAPVEFPFVMADLGTNCEFVLAISPERFFALSIPMGPAIEGIGLSFGRLVGAGGNSAAFTGFRLEPGGLRGITVAGESSGQTLTAEQKPFVREAAVGRPAFSEPAFAWQAPGISGTGYLSLLALLLSNGVISIDGYFGEKEPSAPLAEKLYENIGEDTSGGYFKFEGMRLTAGDIEELLKVKAAFSLALKTLLAKGGVSVTALRRLFLAGALGEHVKIADLHTLGFLPAGLENKTVQIGNSALAGAGLLLFDVAARELACRIKENSILISLTDEPDFMARYLAEMRFEY